MSNLTNLISSLASDGFTPEEGQRILNEANGDVNAIAQASGFTPDEVNAFISQYDLSSPTLVDLNQTGFESSVNDLYTGAATTGTVTTDVYGMDGDLPPQPGTVSTSGTYGVPSVNPTEVDTEGAFEGASTQAELLGMELDRISKSGLSAENQIQQAANLINTMGLSGDAIAQVTDYTPKEVEQFFASQGLNMNGQSPTQSTNTAISSNQLAGLKDILVEAGQGAIDGIADIGQTVADIISLGKAPELEAVIPNIWDLITKGQVGGTVVWGGGNNTPVIIGTSKSNQSPGVLVGTQNPIVGSIINAGKEMIINGASIIDVIKRLPEDLKPQAGAIIGGVVQSGVLNAAEVKENEETLVSLGVDPSIIDGAVKTGEDTVDVLAEPELVKTDSADPAVEPEGTNVINPPPFIEEPELVKTDSADPAVEPEGTNVINPPGGGDDDDTPKGDDDTPKGDDDDEDDTPTPTPPVPPEDETPKGVDPPPSPPPSPTPPTPTPSGGSGLGGFLGASGGIAGLFSPYIPKWEPTRITPVKRLFKS
jgi:hypothetical protein